jgi:hypothetical protein
MKRSRKRPFLLLYEIGEASFNGAGYLFFQVHMENIFHRKP